MKLLIVRHAIAEDRIAFAREHDDDDARPLTGKGRRRMKQAAQGLARVAGNVDLLVTSPLLRAVQTAEIVAKHAEVADVEVRDELRPDADPARIVAWLRKRDAKGVVAVVGHEPHLGRLVGWLVGASGRSPIVLKKGGACLVDASLGARPGQAMLEWALAPRQLRLLARDR